MVRDGETLNLFYNSDDLIVRVTDASNNTVVEYGYDSNGRRVEMSDSTGEKNYLVAPNLGVGLDSPHLVSDAAGNPLASYVYAGEMPLMRLDANGNPTYYLEDGMGSVIGLADGTGSQVTGFQYDSFGNLGTPTSTTGSEVGGDFRFQGQWLESNTDFYHFRARYYDPETGRFISRDPVDLIETEPESFNPYQFVYNNPHVYSDPTGEFTITSLNASQKIQSTLEHIYRKNAARVSRFAINQAKEVATDIFASTLRSLTPSYVSNTGILSFGTQGNVFESLMQGAICGIVSGSFSQYRDNVWLEVGVSQRGNPRNNGRLRCNTSGNPYYITNRALSQRYNHPDFIIKNGQPFQGDRNPPAYLIGDFKRQVTTIKPYGRDGRQWRAILNYARSVVDIDPRNGPGHQYVPVALYVSLFGRSRNNRSKEASLKRKAMRDHRVSLQIVSFL